MNNIDEKEIIQRVKAGETDCFALLVDRYGDRVFSLIFRITGVREDAEELTQDVFLKVYEKIGSYRGDSAFATWLYRITYNQAISKTRKKKYERPVEDETFFNHTESSTSDHDPEKEKKFIAIEKALQMLTGQERILIEMYYYQEKSVEELAQISGLSESNVKVRLFRIRKKIYDRITI